MTQYKKGKKQKRKYKKKQTNKRYNTENTANQHTVQTEKYKN